MKPKAHSFRSFLLLAALLVVCPRGILAESPTPPPVNKLQYMYQFYYLPFSLDFREGQTVNDILPFLMNTSGEPSELIKATDLQALDKDWDAIKERYKSKSLLLSTPVPMNGTVRISNHLVSHRIALTRSPFDGLPLNERIQVASALRSRTPEVQASFKQLRFLKSFLGPNDEYTFNFFMFSASWCGSCKEYRTLFENYLKTFPDIRWTLHSVVIDDPKEAIFDSTFLKELFPHPKKYTHDSIPRFLAFETVGGKSRIYEEGEALKELYERYFQKHQGYLNQKSKVFTKALAEKALAPFQSSLSMFDK